MRATVILFLKEPRPGRVKTRLGRGIGMAAAARWFRRQSAAAIRALRDPRWRLVLAVAPDAALRSRAWPADLPRMAQGGGDLGARMARALRGAPPGPALVVGADIPGLRAAHVARALRALGGAEAVFGPAEDGGFWLVGLKRGRRRAPAGLFAGARWSSPHALADSVASLRGARVAYADRLADVDEAADLTRAVSPGASASGRSPA
jgi:rSAM/selenodomain-associated transferase 1